MDFEEELKRRIPGAEVCFHVGEYYLCRLDQEHLIFFQDTSDRTGVCQIYPFKEDRHGWMMSTYGKVPRWTSPSGKFVAMARTVLEKSDDHRNDWARFNIKMIEHFS